MDLVRQLQQERIKKDIPDFKSGDLIKVHTKVAEAEAERIQVFEGTVIRRRGGGLDETFTVRKISFGVGVERTFPLHSPRIVKIERVKEGRVRRSKLYYLRDKEGKEAKVKEKLIRTQEKEQVKTPASEQK